MITYQDLVDKGPCNAPSLWVSEDWQGTLLDLYNLENLDQANKVLMGVWFLSDDELRAFARWCAVQSGAANAASVAEANPVKAAAWLSAKYSNAAGQSRDDQIQYLIELEQSRG